MFYIVDERITVIPQLKDGDSVKKGDIIAEIIGPSRGILTGERVALNLMQRLSGTASATAKAVSSVAGTNAKIAEQICTGTKNETFARSCNFKSEQIPADKIQRRSSPRMAQTLSVFSLNSVD